ncbi:MAG: cytochrome c [Sphingomonas sp.]
MGRNWKTSTARFWTHNKKLLWAYVAGAATAGLLGGLGALATVEFGLYDTAASQPHNKIVSWALHQAFEQSVARRAGSRSPPAFTQARVISGFKQYQADCMMCHGGPGVARAAWVKGLEPTPPFLLDSGQRLSPAQLDYILEDGIKMTAMPAWGETRSKDQVWNLVAFLKALPGISPAQFAQLQREFPSNKSQAGPPAQPQ